MTSPDDRLAAFFAAELPPARDPGFQARVLEQVARRRFMADLIMLGSVTTVSAAILWLVWPTLWPVLEALGQGRAPGLAAVVAAASIVALTSGRILTRGS